VRVEVEGSRILLVSDHGASGGTRTYAESLVKLFTNVGAHVVLVLTHEDLGLTEVSARLGVEVVPYSAIVGRVEAASRTEGTAGKLLSLARISSERKAFARLVAERKVDRVVISAGRPGALLGVHRSHEASVYVVHTYPHGWKNVLLGKCVFGRLVPPTARLITVSDFAKSALNSAWHLQGGPGRVRCIHSSAGPTLSHPIRREQPISVLTVGALEHYKGPFPWIELARSVSLRVPPRTVEFTWVGGGSLLEACRNLAAESSDYAAIRFLGHADVVGPYYDQADIYVQPSWVESLGLAVLDACRRGLPCLVTNAGGLPEVISDGVNGYVVADIDDSATVERLIRLVEDEQLRQRLGHAAVTSYLRDFAPDRWAREFLELTL
jgi:glycosyltransferase involved in cell wall biosynthesis